MEMSAAMWLAPVTALAGMALAACVILLRDHLRLERHTSAVERELDALKGEFRRIADQAARDQAILEAQADLLVLVDPSGEIVLANESYARFVGRPRERLIGSRRLPHPVRTGSRRALTDRATVIEEAYELLDGERWVSWIETPLASGDGVLRVGREIPSPVVETVPDTALPAELQPRHAQALRLVAANGRRIQRVLLAEDDEVNALLALQSLERIGALVDWAQDGDEALSMVKSSFSGDRPVYDVILMDLRMPRVDGYEATRQIRRLESALQRPEPARIIAISATTMRQDRAAAAAAGIDIFLPKPYSPETLLDALSPGAEARPRVS